MGHAFLVAHLPPQLHLIIATREDLPLPLARLRAQGQLTELRAADLRFTAAEAAAFLNPHPAGDSALLSALRLAFGSGMIVCIILGVATIRRGDVRRHRAWMTRGYALGLGAGTQALILAAGAVILGPPGELGRALLMGAGWVINLAVAEWVIRKRPTRPARTAAAVVVPLH